MNAGMKSQKVKKICQECGDGFDAYDLGRFSRRYCDKCSGGKIAEEEEKQRQAERMATLYRVGLATNSSLDTEAVLVTIYEQCRQVMRADVFYVALYDADKEEVAYPVFFDHGRRLEPFRLPLDTGFAGWIIRNQRPFRSDDTVAEADQLPIKMHRTGGRRTRCSRRAPARPSAAGSRPGSRRVGWSPDRGWARRMIDPRA